MTDDADADPDRDSSQDPDSDRGPDAVLYPNAGDGETPSGRLSRRRLLAGSGAIGVATLTGCAASDGEATTDAGDAITEAPTVFVFNTGEGSVSVIDAESDDLVATVPVGATASFPSNQYAPALTTTADDALWLNVDRGVRALSVGSLSAVASHETGSGANWLEVTPDGRHLVVSAREPTHAQFRIDADPTSETFGEVTGEVDRTSEGGRGDSAGPGPCDVTVHPDGAYAYVPDLFGDTLTVLDVEAFESATQKQVEPVGDGPAKPWMGTAAPDGETLLVEHNEGATGTESVWDVSDPADPTLRGRLTADDGLGKRPLTSEVGPDSETGYVFTPGSNDVTVVDLESGTVSGRIDLGGSAFVGTWDPGHETLYVPVQTNDEVAVIDGASGETATRIDVGPKPYGATAATVRPGERTLSGETTVPARLAALTGTFGTTYCIGNCACGHEL